METIICPFFFSFFFFFTQFTFMRHRYPRCPSILSLIFRTSLSYQSLSNNLGVYNFHNVPHDHGTGCSKQQWISSLSVVAYAFLSRNVGLSPHSTWISTVITRHSSTTGHLLTHKFENRHLPSMFLQLHWGHGILTCRTADKKAADSQYWMTYSGDSIVRQQSPQSWRWC